MLWLKAWHLIAVVSWFAGLFYLPRLFVYHAMTDDEVGRARFEVMERKLYRGIMWPAMIMTVGLGLWMLLPHWDIYRMQGWMHAKLALAALLVAYHFLCGRFLRDLRDGRNTRSHVFYRIFNELPVLGLVGIVILVIVRPF
jgi:putative membrane protein